jgi:uncharacterized membrane protein
MILELAILTFPHPDGAEQAYAHLGPLPDDTPWAHEVAFVERHRHDRITVRGTFAGQYLDIEAGGDVIGRDTLVGALTGAVIGAAFGPPGFAAGLVAGGSIGGVLQSRHGSTVEGELFERIRVHVPEGASAIALVAAPEHVDAMLAALAGFGGDPYRCLLLEEQVEQLRAGLSGVPPARPAPLAPA